MLGKCVVLRLGMGYDVKVWVACIPGTPEKELTDRAFKQLQQKLEVEYLAFCENKG